VTLFKDNLARADALPLVLPLLGAGGLPRGARVRVRLGEIDEVTLDINATVLVRLDAAPDDASAPADAEEAEDEDEVAGPIAIAVDLAEPEAAASSGASDPPAL
jgi:exoribonuclease-2